MEEEEEEEVDWREVREYVVANQLVGDEEEEQGGAWRARFKDFSGQRCDWNPVFLFWRDLIVSICLRFGIMFLRPSSLINNCFNRGGLTPLCLPRVFLLMYEEEGHLVRPHQLLDPRTGRLSLLFRKLSNFLFTSSTTCSDDDDDDDVVYLVMPVLKEKAGQLLQLLSEDNSSIVTFSRFQHLCGGSSSSASAILSYLSSQSKARFLSLHTPSHHLHIQGVKVSLSASPVSNASSLDYDVLHLIWTTETLDHQLSVIDKRCERSKKSALASLASGNKNVALRHMRAFKLATESRDKCTSLLNRVEEVLHLIANAESTSKVFEALQIGAQAIKENKISVKEVERTLQELEDSIDLQKQVETALESPPSYTFVDEEDIEEEFKKLELEIGSGNNAQPPIPEGEAYAAATETEALDSTESLNEAFSNLKVADGMSSTAAGQNIPDKETKNLELEAA